MKNLIIPFLISLFLSFFNFEGLSQDSAKTDDPITFGVWDTIQSSVLDEERALMVYVPKGKPGEKYPVVYLLDGSGHYYSMAGMIRQLSSVNGNTICPKMIVVGILNTNRMRDLTPTKAEFDPPFMDSARVANTGGGENFTSFIEKELIPYIDENYPTQPYRMFIGHSLGGLMVMNTWLHHTSLFNAYLAIDPSLWWGDGALLKEIKNTAIDENFGKASLFLGIANTMEEGMDTAMVQTDTSGMTGHIRAILELNKYLKANAGEHLRYAGKYYHEDSHGSVPLIAEYDALRFLFSFYRLDLGAADFEDPNSDLSSKLKKHYKVVSNHLGYEVKPEEDFVNRMGYQFLSMKQYDKAGALFKMNVVNYPESDNVYDSLADYYDAVGDKEHAIINYEKSLLLNKESPSKEKLAKLKDDN